MASRINVSFGLHEKFGRMASVLLSSARLQSKMADSAKSWGFRGRLHGARIITYDFYKSTTQLTPLIREKKIETALGHDPARFSARVSNFLFLAHHALAS